MKSRLYEAIGYNCQGKAKTWKKGSQYASLGVRCQCTCTTECKHPERKVGHKRHQIWCERRQLHWYNGWENSCVKKCQSLQRKSMEEVDPRRYEIRWKIMIFELWASWRQWQVTETFSNMLCLSRPIKPSDMVAVDNKVEWTSKNNPNKHWCDNKGLDTVVNMLCLKKTNQDKRSYCYSWFWCHVTGTHTGGWHIKSTHHTLKVVDTGKGNQS